MLTTRIKAFAKINLHLSICGKRTDGFHEIRTVMQSIDLHDVLDITLDPGRKPNDFTLTSNAGHIPCDRSNLILKSLDALAKEGWRPDCGGLIHLEKNLPDGAGLGGGSSDGAAALLGVASLCRIKPSMVQLIKATAAVGSDLTFFLCGGTALCTGRGEEVTPLADMPPIPGLLVMPRGEKVPTAAAYSGLPKLLTDPHTDFKLVLGLAGKRTPWEAMTTWTNTFQDILVPDYPGIGSALDRLKATGASLVRMTGSGAGVYALFEKEKARNQALAALQEDETEFDFLAPFSTLQRKQYQAEETSWLWT